MTYGLDPSTERFLIDTNRLQARLNRAEAQITSGLRITHPSDDPGQIERILTLSANLDRATQIQHNFERVKTEVDTAEQALQTATKLLDQVSARGAQGATFTSTPQVRISLAGEIASLQQQLVSVSNSQVDGRFLFSGDADQTPPYDLDLSTAIGATPYAGAATTRKLEDLQGSAVPISQNAQEIFDTPGGASVFRSVNALRVALLANDQPGMLTALDGIRAARDQLAGSLSFYGSVQNQVSATIDATAKQSLQIRSNLSAVQDADIAEASLVLTNTRVQQDAAYSARARLPLKTLFDYLG